MKTLKYLTAAGLLAAAAAAVATEGSSVISEQAGAKNSTVTADVAVQAPTPAVKQKTALSPEEWQRVLAAMPKAEVMNGFAVHSKQFCASCHGKEGIADTPNWPDVAGQPYAVTVKALLDYRNGRRKGTPASDLMSAAAAKLTDQQIADVAALYEYLPGRNAKKAAPTTPAPELVNSGDASRYITPCAACHGIDARGNNNGLVPVLHGQQATFLAAALGGASYLFQLKGAINLPATVLYPFITGGSIIFTALAGRVFFGEKPKKRTLTGIALCFLGTVLFL